MDTIKEDKTHSHTFREIFWEDIGTFFFSEILLAETSSAPHPLSCSVSPI